MPILAHTSKPPENLAEIVARINKYPDFAYNFALTVRTAMGGDPNPQNVQDAKVIVAEYFQPNQRDLDSFGIPSSEQGTYAHCTDVGKLILVTCKDAAPFIFPS
jgi:hypothetical protein